VLPACVVRPELSQGPYFVDEMLNRSDIRSDPADGSVREGAPVTLTVRVSRIDGSGCAPLDGAQVDVWHCDALGVYSDVADPGFNTQGQKFLRGYQITDSSGLVSFTTIYPGWYQGRAVHIHFKIRTDPASGAGFEFTSQWFFDDALSDVVHAESPYAAKGQRTLMNDGDRIFQESGGQTVLEVVPTEDGYAAVFDIGLQID
jgi:protocatechuate 3,4-dioxygenase beta subunit